MSCLWSLRTELSRKNDLAHLSPDGPRARAYCMLLWRRRGMRAPQSTSSIFDASSAAPSTSSRGGRSSSSPRPSSSSSMLRPSLIMRWMRPANCVGSSRLKPDVRRDVSNRSQIKSLTVLSDLSADAFFLSSDMMECLGLTSMVFLDTMYEVMELSLRACAFMMRSMLADHPYSEVVSTQGES